MAPKISKRITKALPWLPAAAIMGVGLASAIGLQPIGPAIAASGGSPQSTAVTVNATVSPEVSVTDCGGAGPAKTTIAMGSILPSSNDALPAASASNCDILFGTNNGASSALQLNDANTTNPMLCERPAATPLGACTAGANYRFTPAAQTDDVWGAAGAADMPEGSIGFNPNEGAITGYATPCALAAPYNNADTTWDYPFASTAQNVCTRATTGTALYKFDVDWDPVSTQMASTNYQGQFTITATAA